MKNIFFFFVASVFFFSNAHAQRSASEFFSFQKKSSASDLRNVTDTIILPSFIPVFDGGLGCFTGVYASPDSGYVSGNNQYGDLAKAQFYSLSKLGYGDTGAVKNVLIDVAYKTLSAAPGDLYVQIFNCDTSQFQPMDLLGTSQAVNISNVNAAGSHTLFSFTSPVQVSDSFFISLVLPSAKGDTIALLSTDDGCVSNNGWAFEQWKNGTWHQIVNSWLLNIDLAIFPVVDLPLTGIEQLSDSKSISVFPNPVSENCNISIPDNFKDEFNVKVMNMEGKEVLEMKSVFATDHSLTLNLSALSNGVYTIVLQSSACIVTGKAIVLHK